MSARLAKLELLRGGLEDLDGIQEEIESIRNQQAEDNEEFLKQLKVLERYRDELEKTQTRLTKLTQNALKQIRDLQAVYDTQVDDLAEGLELVDRANALADALDLTTV